MNSIRLRLRVRTPRLSTTSSTKKLQGLKASRPASTTVSSGSDVTPRSTVPKPGMAASRSSSPAVAVVGVVPAVRSAWQASRASASAVPVVSCDRQPTSMRPQ